MHFFHILAHTHNKKQATHKSFLFHSFILFKCKRNDDRQSSKMHFLVSICTFFLKYLDRSRHHISIHRTVKFTKKCKNGLYSSLIFSWCAVGILCIQHTALAQIVKIIYLSFFEINLFKKNSILSSDI